jgi:hypothetical protein
LNIRITSKPFDRYRCCLHQEANAKRERLLAARTYLLVIYGRPGHGVAKAVPAMALTGGLGEPHPGVKEEAAG